MNQTFGKEYKLCSQVILEKLFQEGKKVHEFPFLIYYLLIEQEDKNKFQVVVSVPKRKFKHAHDRNYIKRSVIECLRKNKLIFENLLKNNKNSLFLGIIFNFDQHLNSIEIEQKLLPALIKLSNQIKPFC